MLPSVLLVEADPAIVELLTWVLVERGYPVQETPTGWQALDVLHGSDRPLIVLLDDRLPDLDGLSLLRHIQAAPWLAATHACILLSALPAGRLTDPPAGSTSLPVGFLPKPFDLRQLWTVLDTATEWMKRSPPEYLLSAACPQKAHTVWGKGDAPLAEPAFSATLRWSAERRGMRSATRTLRHCLEQVMELGPDWTVTDSRHTWTAAGLLATLTSAQPDRLDHLMYLRLPDEQQDGAICEPIHSGGSLLCYRIREADTHPFQEG
ncbi:MAG TPA: response regulator [Ktedonobacterales bacterium]|nr:response regulator [Ktedonobacterales bacterium]